MTLMLSAAEGHDWSEAEVSALADALGDTLASPTLDPSFKALTLNLPSESLVARTIGTGVDPDRVRAVRTRLLGALSTMLEDILMGVYGANSQLGTYLPSTEQSGKRALRNAALSLLTLGGQEAGTSLARQQYENAANMTDRYAALAAVVGAWTPDAEALLGNFRTMYTADPLVFDKWLALNAVAPDDNVVARLSAILADPTFPKNNPNRLRALMANFGLNNPSQFARLDGSGFRLVTDFVADVDQRNPQVAARVLTAFRVWKSYEPLRMAAAESALTSLRGVASLSRNTADILERTLAG
jgi:aminopeptidase N